jgi:outer membrane protein OmpA-like peptidoglycan-associated protein
MNGPAIDKSEPIAAESSDLRSRNPWLASYGRDAARGAWVSETRRATRSSGPSALKLRLWGGAAGVALLMLGISSTEYVEAEGTSASPGHYPLDQDGGIAVSSANLAQYLATMEERATARRFLLTFGDLLFSAGSAQIGDSEKGELVRMADFLRAHPATVARIVGHADDRGDATVNSRLAEQRAAAVRTYLVGQGIDPSRLTADSPGEDNPLLDSRTQSGGAGNRRVEIVVQKSQIESSGGLQ